VEVTVNVQFFRLLESLDMVCAERCQRSRLLPTVFYVLDFPLLAQYSTLLAQIHRNFCSSCVWRIFVEQDMVTWIGLKCEMW